jgi:hypothetical protein
MDPWCKVTHVMAFRTVLCIGHCRDITETQVFLLTTRNLKATHLDRVQPNCIVQWEEGQILLHLQTTKLNDKIRYKNKKQQKRYISLGFILERCSVQRARRIEGKDRSLSGSTHKGFVEYIFGNELTAVRPTTVLIVWTFVLQLLCRMVDFWADQDLWLFWLVMRFWFRKLKILQLQARRYSSPFFSTVVLFCNVLFLELTHIWLVSLLSLNPYVPRLIRAVNVGNDLSHFLQYLSLFIREILASYRIRPRTPNSSTRFPPSMSLDQTYQD